MATAQNRQTELHRQMVTALKAHPDGLTEGELREKLSVPTAAQAQFGRRRRELYNWYRIEKLPRGRDILYRYVGQLETPRDAEPISSGTRARILLRDRSTCQMCGRAPQVDGVRLLVDHKIPRDWGGKTEDENLWSLCEECSAGKRKHFASKDPVVMRAVVNDRSVHKRIGELLKLYDGRPVPAELIEFVANQGAWQDDWKKRTRELRYLGWKIVPIKEKNERGRVKVYYKLVEWKPWPEDPTRWIRDFEKDRATRNRRYRRDALNG
jgi:5-methylcytosine-specific restriction endonuclease McrA